MTKKNKTKRNSKNSYKMTFKRWGTLAPQEHLRENDFYCYHDVPVKMGIFAFPEKLTSRWDVSNPCLSNGRLQYVKDENGKKFLMTKREFVSVKTKERKVKEWRWPENVVVSPKYLRGLYYDYLDLEEGHDDDNEGDDNEGNDNEGNDNEGNDNDFFDYEAFMKPYYEWLDDDKRYPIIKETDWLRTFKYGGNIWHHLEFTNNWHHWIRTDDGIKETIKEAYDNKKGNENYDLEGALNSIITGQYGKEYHFDYETDSKIKRLVKPEDIIRRSGSWILTDMRTYKKALEKAVHIAKYEEFMKLKAKGEVEGFPMGLPKREISPTWFEVYIERVN